MANYTVSGLHLFNETSVQTLGYNSAQIATFRLFWTVAYIAKTRHLMDILGADTLVAPAKLYTALLARGHRLSSALSNHQWQIEVENMHNITMAVLQLALLDHPAPADVGDIPIKSKSYYIQETDPESRQLCSSQKNQDRGILLLQRSRPFSHPLPWCRRPPCQRRHCGLCTLDSKKDGKRHTPPATVDRK